MKILSIQDLSCYGQCSLTVALPILSAYGYETAILPSSVLSTHTTGFIGYTKKDLTEEMTGIINHWKEEGILFDCIYTGYVGERLQFDAIMRAKKEVLREGGVFIVDTAMADDGRLYPSLDESIVQGMKGLICGSDYALPNVTEASFLTGIEYKEEYDEKYVTNLLVALKDLGVKTPIITGVLRGKKIGAVALQEGKEIAVFNKKQPKGYHGTGDVFSSVVVAGIMDKKPIKRVLKNAVRFVSKSIKYTLKEEGHDYGVSFEKTLKKQRKIF